MLPVALVATGEVDPTLDWGRKWEKLGEAAILYCQRDICLVKHFLGRCTMFCHVATVCELLNQQISKT